MDIYLHVKHHQTHQSAKILAHCGPLLWAILGPHWARVGTPWALVGSPCALVGSPWALVGTLGPLGPPQGRTVGGPKVSGGG